MNFTPNANSLVARRGSKRVVREGEGLSTTLNLSKPVHESESL